LTVLIGPQASGKSVISKLVYFFNDILTEQFRAIEDNIAFEQFAEGLCETFKKWFPQTAWGSKAFEISYKAGAYFVKVSKSSRGGAGRSEVRMDFSKWFQDEFNLTATAAAEQRKEIETKSARDVRAHSLDFIWRIREVADKRMQAALRNEYIPFQVFIPAGRSYFTSLGKALPAFEYSGLLDPVTVAFGKFFTGLREFRERRLQLGGRNPLAQDQQAFSDAMFGGRIRFDREQGYVDGLDGRKIPLGFLSSGQQELLPLWLTIEYLAGARANCLLFIEEPEAHLLPAAQSQVIELLAAMLALPNAHVRMIITTHSPYVLTQLNILLKAGTLSFHRPDVADKIAKVVKRRSWLPPGSTAAYAIAGKRVKKIFDESGLVDGHYLDEVSGSLESEFQKLLEIEFPP
jgi:hypothetical protein